MAIKARETITIIKERDVNATWRFYRIASSTSTPSQPTEAQGKAYVNNQTVPSGWSIAEPAYDGTSTNSLYTCDLTYFTDGEVSWSTVSKSSSYEAAKQAYNEAQNAKRVATDYLTETTANGLMVHPSTDSTTGWRIKDALELLVSGVSHIWAGIQSGVALIRVGIATAGNVIMSGDGYVDVRHGSTVMAHFGYEQGNAESGKSSAPYYTLGLRVSSGEVGNYSVAEGNGVTASGYTAHAEGRGSIASGIGAHAEGGGSVTGWGPLASGSYSHAEGTHTVASSYCAHAEGDYTQALHQGTHSQNVGTIASKWAQTAMGKYNVEDPNQVVDPDTYYDRGKYALIIGNGRSVSNRSNAFTVGWDGEVDASAGYKIGGSKLIKVATCSKDNISISKASTASGDITPTAYTGYTPIGVIGYDLNSASSSGVNLSSCVPLAIYFSSGTVSYQIRNNNSSSAAKIKIIARVLYVRSELI